MEHELKKSIKTLIDRFLVACTRLYNPLCPSVGPSVGRSVRDAFVKNGKIDDFDRK